jgi:hypothetical protein
MTLYYALITALWLLFILYWIAMAFGAKKSLGRSEWLRGAGVRAGILIAVLVLVRIPTVREVLRMGRGHPMITDPLLGVVGVVICACGIGLAIWARVYLGRNWGMPMSRKRDPELVTGGPYRYVRHPIYTGIFFAMLGSAVGQSLVWILPLLLGGAYFVYSARREEQLMTEQFPQQYPAYMKRTKMLLPFIF